MKKALILIACAATGFANAQIVTNGDFSQDVYPASGWKEINTLSGWNVIGNDMAGIGVGYLGAKNQEIDLSGGYDQGGTGISQMLNTVSGKQYKLSFDVYTGGDASSVGYSVGQLTGGVDLSVGGNSLATNLQGFGELSANATGNASSDRRLYTFDFTAASSSTNLTFMDNHGNVSHVGNVSVQAVPEPASLLALGVPALGLLRRRSKK